jgi:hypothetical protein
MLVHTRYDAMMDYIRFYLLNLVVLYQIECTAFQLNQIFK